MSKLDKIKYLASPVSKAEKAEWNKKGYRIIDARFEPEQEKPKKAKAKK